MLGAILGDIVGSVYEFDNIKSKDFALISAGSNYTDDTIMSVAVADWILHGGAVGKYLLRYAKQFPCPKGGYGGNFVKWLRQGNALGIIPEAYNSCGNGSAMRVSAVGWAFDTIEDTIAAARLSAAVTHNHPEGIKGAEATAVAIFMARNGADKLRIRRSVEDRYGYDLSQTCDMIRPHYGWGALCQDTVPQAFAAFLEATDYEDAIRNAVSLGGDSDTLACITGGIAEAYFGMPDDLRAITLEMLDPGLREVVEEFRNKYINH